MKHEQEKNPGKSGKDEATKKRTINRKEAIKKTGYMALSAATMMLLINKPSKANGGPISSPAPPIW
jgi:hypothetical protein